MKKKENKKELLNLNFLDLTNKTKKIGPMDFPRLVCSRRIEVNYLASFSRPSEYF